MVWALELYFIAFCLYFSLLHKKGAISAFQINHQKIIKILESFLYKECYIDPDKGWLNDFHPHFAKILLLTHKYNWSQSLDNPRIEYSL